MGLKITWGEKLGRPECPYIQRWVLDLGFCSLRFHKWLHSDDPRHFHDHPWWYISLVLKGSYNDVSPKGTIKRTPGTIAFYPAIHQHTVQITKSPCWTILITGSEKRVWGFWVKGRFRKRNRYFYDHGNPPCDSK
jgi:hypothetical protein